MTFDEWWEREKADALRRNFVYWPSHKAVAKLAWIAATETQSTVVEPPTCPECNDSGYAVHPENGWNKNSRRCSRGCTVRCSVCNDPNCDNPGGQH